MRMCKRNIGENDQNIEENKICPPRKRGGERKMGNLKQRSIKEKGTTLLKIMTNKQ